VLTVFDPAGAIFAQVGVHEDGTMFGVNTFGCAGPFCGVSEHPANFYYIDILGLTNPTPPAPTILLETATTASDLFGAIHPQGAPFQGTVLSFSSDGEFPVGFSSGFIVLPEGNGGPFDATAYLNPTFVAQGYTATFLSDPVEAPEPATYGLAMCGALSLVMRRRRSRVV